MKNIFRNILKSEDGFTLVELLVVVLIIGILVMVVVPSFLGQQTKADQVDAKSRISTAYKALKSASTSNAGNYPLNGAAKALAINQQEIGSNAGFANAGISEDQAGAIDASGNNLVGVSGVGNTVFLAASKNGTICFSQINTTDSNIVISCIS